MITVACWCLYVVAASVRLGDVRGWVSLNRRSAACQFEHQGPKVSGSQYRAALPLLLRGQVSGQRRPNVRVQVHVIIVDLCT